MFFHFRVVRHELPLGGVNELCTLFVEVCGEVFFLFVYLFFKKLS